MQGSTDNEGMPAAENKLIQQEENRRWSKCSYIYHTHIKLSNNLVQVVTRSGCTSWPIGSVKVLSCSEAGKPLPVVGQVLLEELYCLSQVRSRVTCLLCQAKYLGTLHKQNIATALPSLRDVTLYPQGDPSAWVRRSSLAVEVECRAVIYRR